MKIRLKKISQKQDTVIKEVALVLFISLVGLAMHLGVKAADTATVGATVTAQQVSLSVSDGDVAYGTVEQGQSLTTLDVGSTDTQTITNTGNVSADFGLQGTDSVSAGTTWALVGTSPGADEYSHEYSTDGGSTWPGYLQTGSYTNIASGVASSGTQDFDLRITMPSSTSSQDEQSVDVSVQASASN